MLLQTNSYIVPKEKRAEHARLLRRFRQVLLRFGCDHFEVYEQVGNNWNTGETTGRFVQILRFRDRKHQLAVQTAERTDPQGQQVVAEFCDLINFSYQQQQGLFAVGFYTSFLKMPPQRTIEAQAGEAQPGEAQAGEAQPGEAQAGEAQAGEAQAGEAQAGEEPQAETAQAAEVHEAVDQHQTESWQIAGAAEDKNGQKLQAVDRDSEEAAHQPAGPAPENGQAPQVNSTLESEEMFADGEVPTEGSSQPQK